MPTTREYAQLVFPYNFSSVDYLFLYTDDEKNVFVSIQPITESAYKPEADIPDENVVDTMVDDILE